MIDSIIKGFETWTDAQGVKSKGRVKSIDNISLEGVNQLKQLILKFALEGKLTSHELNDEPSIELLKRIDTERSTKLSNEILEIPDNEAPYTLPKGWEWVRLQRIIQISSGDGLTASQMNSNGGIPVYGGNGINGYHDKANISKPTLVIGRVGFYCGSVHITPSLAWVTDNAFVTIFSESNIDLNFLYLLLKGTNLKEKESATAQPVISGRKIYPIIVGLPPLEEQKRIVAKVNELISLCDKLEEEQTNNLTTHHNLVKCLLETLTQANDANELQTSWEKISQHFDTVFCTEDSIAQLKGAVLQMAIMGKLVKQDFNDEPAIELLKSIKRDKNTNYTSENQGRYPIPENWLWCKLEEIIELRSGNSINKDLEKDSGEIPYLKVGDMNQSGNESIITTSSRFVDRTPNVIKSIIPSFSIIFPKRGGAIATNKKRIVQREIIVDLNTMAMIIPKPIFEYIRIWFDTIDLWELNNGTSVPQINNKDIYPLLIPIPPFAEQKRIVKKVDELFAICELLKVRISKSEEIKNTLSNSIIEIV